MPLVPETPPVILREPIPLTLGELAQRMQTQDTTLTVEYLTELERYANRQVETLTGENYRTFQAILDRDIRTLRAKRKEKEKSLSELMKFDKSKVEISKMCDLYN